MILELIAVEAKGGQTLTTNSNSDSKLQSITTKHRSATGLSVLFRFQTIYSNSYVERNGLRNSIACSANYPNPTLSSSRFNIAMFNLHP